MGGRIPEKNDIDREIELEHMRFARNELSARAKLNLSLILTEEQTKVLPGLQGR
jgi:hypothetical protein